MYHAYQKKAKEQDIEKYNSCIITAFYTEIFRRKEKEKISLQDYLISEKDINVEKSSPKKTIGLMKAIRFSNEALKAVK